MTHEQKAAEYRLIKGDIHSILRRVDAALDELRWPQDYPTMTLAKKHAEELEAQVDYLHSIAIRLGKNVLGKAVEHRLEASTDD